MCLSQRLVVAVASNANAVTFADDGNAWGVAVKVPADELAACGLPPTVTEAEVEVVAKLAGETGVVHTFKLAPVRFFTGTQAEPTDGPDDCTACTETAVGWPPVMTPELGGVMSSPSLDDTQVQDPPVPLHLLGLLGVTGMPLPTTARVDVPTAA
jgi:hypothetical protein